MVNLKLFRTSNHLVQKDIADFLNVSVAFISQVESGLNKLPPDKLAMLLANEKGWDPEYLVNGEPRTMTYNNMKTQHGGQDFGASSFYAPVNIGGRSDEEVENLLKINLCEYEAENRALRVQVNQLNRENTFLRSKYTELIDTLAQIGFNLPKNLYLADANDSDINIEGKLL